MRATSRKRRRQLSSPIESQPSGRMAIRRILANYYVDSRSSHRPLGTRSPQSLRDHAPRTADQQQRQQPSPLRPPQSTVDATHLTHSTSTSIFVSRPLHRSTSPPNPWNLSSIAVASAASPHPGLESGFASIDACAAPIPNRSLSQSIGLPAAHTMAMPSSIDIVASEFTSIGILPHDSQGVTTTQWVACPPEQSQLDSPPISVAAAAAVSVAVAATTSSATPVNIGDGGCECARWSPFDSADDSSGVQQSSCPTSGSNTMLPVDRMVGDEPRTSLSLLAAASLPILCRPSAEASAGQLLETSCQTTVVVNTAAPSSHTCVLAQQTRLERPADRAILAPYLSPKFQLPVDWTMLPREAMGSELAIGISKREESGSLQLATSCQLPAVGEQQHPPKPFPTKQSASIPIREPRSTTARRIDVACRVEWASRCVLKPRPELIRSLSKFSVRPGYRGSSTVIARSTTAPIVLLSAPIESQLGNPWVLASPTCLPETRNLACQSWAEVLLASQSLHGAADAEHHAEERSVIVGVWQTGPPMPALHQKTRRISAKRFPHRPLVIGLDMPGRETKPTDNSLMVHPPLCTNVDASQEPTVALAAPVSTPPLLSMVHATELNWVALGAA